MRIFCGNTGASTRRYWPGRRKGRDKPDSSQKMQELYRHRLSMLDSARASRRARAARSKCACRRRRVPGAGPQRPAVRARPRSFREGLPPLSIVPRIARGRHCGSAAPRATSRNAARAHATGTERRPDARRRRARRRRAACRSRSAPTGAGTRPTCRRRANRRASRAASRRRRQARPPQKRRARTLTRPVRRRRR